MINPLLQEIEIFLARDDVRLTETAFGIAALNDGKFVGELRAGRRVWPDTAEKVMAFIRDYSPAIEGRRQEDGAAA